MPNSKPSFQELVISTVIGSINADFYFDPKKFMIKNVCKAPYTPCVIKMTGVVRDNLNNPLNFIATTKFNVVMEESGLEAKLTDINVCDITLIGKYDTAPTSCGDFKIYYNINEQDCCDSSEVVDDNNELIIYNVIETAFSNAIVTFLPDKLTVSLPFQTNALPNLSYVIGGVIVGSNDPCNKNFNQYSITGCCKCKPPTPPFPPINRIIIILLKILMFVMFLMIIDPCCKWILPKWVCKIKKELIDSMRLSLGNGNN